MEIQTMDGKFCLRYKGKTLLGIVNKLLVFKSLLTTPSNVLLTTPQTNFFPPIIWIFTEGEGDGIEYRLPFKIFSTLHHKKLYFLQSIWLQCGRFMTSRIPKMLRFVLSILFLSLVWSLISWLDLNHQNQAVFSVKDIQKQVGSHDISTNVYKMSSFSIHFWIFPVGYKYMIQS